MDGPIVILSALSAELRHLRDDLDRVRGEPSVAGTAWRGRLRGRDVVLAQVGIGKVASALVATSVITEVRPRALLFTGVAGGLDPALAVGDVVVAKRVVQHDAGMLTPDGLQRYQAGHLPFFNPTDAFGWDGSPALVERAVAAARELDLPPLPVDAGGSGTPPRVTEGVVATGDAFVTDPATRRQLHEQLGAHAVEMEGGAVAQVAATLGVDHVIVRALSDLAGDDSPVDFTRFLHHVSAASAAIVAGVVESL